MTTNGSFLKAMLLLAVVRAKADVIPSSYRSEAGAGTFYIQNVSTGKFFNSYSRTVQDEPYGVVVTSTTGGYLISGYGSGKYLKLGDAVDYLWNDDTSGTKIWKFNTVDAGAKTYTISSDVVEGKMAAGNWYVWGTGNGASQTGENIGTWILVTEANYTTYQSLSQTEKNKAFIVDAKGDATSLLPALNTWTNASGKNDGYWDNASRWVVEQRNTTISITLSNMPAGTYKLVGATRGAKNQYVTMTVNGTTSGNFWSYNADNAGEQAINLRGVQLPYSDKGGFNTTYWRWASVTGTLAADGDLPLSIYLSGSSWNQVTELHLYYMGDGVNTYALAYSDGVDAANHAVTCDIISADPNKIFTSTATINNTNGTAISNNLVSGTVANLVLYDGYEFSTDADFTATAATLYRSIAADAFATVCAPFPITGGADGTFYEPTSLSEGILNFGTEASPAAGKAYLYKASSAVTALTGSGTVKTSPVDNGTGATMKGRYLTTTASTGDYILSSGSLYKVGSTGTVTVNPFRAYFTVPSNEARISLVFDDDTPTFINTIDSQEQNADSQYYDLQGRKVASPTKGLYIVNGNKVSVR